MGQPYLLRPLPSFQPKIEKLASKFSFADNEDVVPAHLEGGRWQTGDASFHMAILPSPSPLPSATLIRDLFASSLSNRSANYYSTCCSRISGKGQALLEAYSITGLSWKCGGKWESDDGSGCVGGCCGQYITASVLGISMSLHLSLL